MDDLLLREICRLTGVSRRAIQGYEKEGLVMPCGKNKYGYLLYSSTTIGRIKEIKLYQERGFTLKEIKSFELLNKEEFKIVLIQKISELEKKQSYLKTVSSQIQMIISIL